jgi:AraC-like DNA-binding protein
MDGENSLRSYATGPRPAGARVDLAGWREAVGPVFDVEPHETSFEAAIASYPLGEMLFAVASASGQRFVRNEEVIARSSADHLLVQLYTRGGFECSTDGVNHTIETGDISCLDLGRSFNSQATDFASFSLIVPRRLLFVMPNDASLHARVLPANLVRARVLAAHFHTLAALAPTADSFDQDILGVLTAALLEAAFVTRGQATSLPAEADRSLHTEICRHIEANLSDPALSADRLCAEFGASRATLYRMFHRSGGVASFIRERRLELAYRVLSNEAHSRERISSLARRCGFRNDDTFARAFKERFGIGPTQQRRQAGRTD